ncbi:MAG: hypothetical protein QM539_09800 [Alphaproteobacteria bacterium]|nr:hypothetical protein [Alphaproteobacteria bacterium]
MELILKVQKSFKKFRLEFSKEDSNVFIKQRGLEIKLQLNNTFSFQVKTSCGPPNNKGYDLSNSLIDAWILENNFHQYPKGKPTKLIFILDDSLVPVCLKFKSVSVL